MRGRKEGRKERKVEGEGGRKGEVEGEREEKVWEGGRRKGEGRQTDGWTDVIDGLYS